MRGNARSQRLKEGSFIAGPTHVDEADFQKEVLQAKKPVLVDFYADWCGPCRALEPVIEELSDELGDRLKVVRLDVDENQELSLQHGVQSIPTLVLFNGGQEVDRIVGFLPKANLREALEPHLDSRP